MAPAKIVVTGTGAVCAAGLQPAAVYERLQSGKTAIGPIGQWDTTGWPVTVAGEIADFSSRTLVADRKLHKLIRRTDLMGLYAATRAIEASGLVAHRETLDPDAAAVYSDRSGVYVGSGGGNYQSQYDFFPLMTAAQGALPAFGRELGNTVNPMWLLRTLPNNVLGHIGIQQGLKGPNACVTHHSAGGVLAIIEALEGLRRGEADRAVAVGHDAPIEPQMQLYYHRAGLLAAEALRPFDVRHDGSLFGEGAAALVLETAHSAAARGAPVLGEVLGGGVACEAEGLLGIREDGEGVARAIELALTDAGIVAADVGMIVAHGNGTRLSDVSEAAALRRVFGAAMPPVTAFKWAFGHLIAAAGTLDTVLALEALRRGEVPGLSSLTALDPECAPLAVSATTAPARGDIALIVNRGFASTNVALIVRA